MNHYENGLQQEIYTEYNLDHFSGRPFLELAIYAFRRYGILLIGLTRESKVMINPSKLVIQEGDKAIFIAPDLPYVQSSLDSAPPDSLFHAFVDLNITAGMALSS